MPLRGRAVAAAAAALLLLVAACGPPDYGAVRGWAGVAGFAADYPPAARSCTAPVAAAELPAATRDGMRAMQEALATWLGALATLAADGVLPYREDPFLALAPRAARENEAGGLAVAALGVLLREASLRNDRAPQLRDAIRAGDEPVQALVHALRESAAAAGRDAAATRAAVAAAQGRLAAGLRDPGARLLLREVAALRDEGLAAREAAIAGYAAVLVQIGQGHVLLTARARHLAQEETGREVRAAEDRLRRAAAAQPRALAPLPDGVACPDPAGAAVAGPG